MKKFQNGGEIVKIKKDFAFHSLEKTRSRLLKFKERNPSSFFSTFDEKENSSILCIKDWLSISRIVHHIFKSTLINMTKNIAIVVGDFQKSKFSFLGVHSMPNRWTKSGR